MTYNASMRVWRGDDSNGELQDFTVEVNEGEVVLDTNTGSCGALELQSRQMRLLLGGDQR